MPKDDCLGVWLVDRREFGFPDINDIEELRGMAQALDEADPYDAIPTEYIRATIDDIHRMLPNCPTNCETALNWLMNRWERDREEYAKRRR